MANHDVSPSGGQGVVDRRRTTSPANSAGSFATPANYASISAMRSRLAAINAGRYTTAVLDAMTENDMVHAIRLNDDAASV